MIAMKMNHRLDLKSYHSHVDMDDKCKESPGVQILYLSIKQLGVIWVGSCNIVGTMQAASL